MPLNVDTVIAKLHSIYPDADCTLDWSNPLELLVAAILSAQCTDARVNKVTQTLFIKYRCAQDYTSVSLEELEEDIRSCGTYHVKAKFIQESCMILLDKFDGEVPKTMEEMLQLRGVGRKTAAVVLATAYGVIEGIPIDTHNIRLLRRLGLTKKKEQKSIELDLMKKTSKQNWPLLSHLLIAHGRAICTAKSPACHKCIFAHNCPSSSVRRNRK